jgi:long-chain acyl-CoA synthetase
VIAPYKVPHQIEFMAELPKTPNGKILRRVLRERG